MNVSSALKETSRSVVAGRSVLGKALLVVQVAISLVLLVGAGLFLQTLQNLRRVDVGFNAQNLVLFRVNPQLSGYTPKQQPAMYAEMADRLRSVPGVRSVSLSHVALLSGSENTTSIFVAGRSYAQGQHDSINRLVVSPSFFGTMELPLVAGRVFA